MAEIQPDWEYQLYSNRSLGCLEPPLNGFQQVGRPFPASRWLWMQAVLPWTIRWSQPHLCHFPNSLAPLWQSQPYVITIHDASLYLFRAYHPWTRHLAMRMILPLVARRASAIITVSEHSRQDLIRILNLPADKLYVVHEAAPEYFRPVIDRQKLETIRRQYHLPDQYLLYVGTLEPRKNLKRLLQAIRRLHDAGIPVPLVIAGPQGWMMDDFQAYVAGLGLQAAVHYLGYVPMADLPALYSLATLFVFPSLYEGFGLPPLEAMACGTPVLSSNRSSMAEICGQAAVLINPECAEEIADSIHDLLTDEPRRMMYRERGLERAKYFSWKNAAGQTIEIYQQTLQGQAA
jgi:glycosyltransferase involved in cell wall biosynthesis